VGVILNLLDQVHGLRKVLADMLQSVRAHRGTSVRSSGLLADQSYEELTNGHELVPACNEKPQPGSGDGAGASIVGTATQQSTHATSHLGYKFVSALT
jgi:hypothetical protein